MEASGENIEFKKRPGLMRKVVLGINLALVFVLGSFIVWDSYVEWNTHITEKKTALEEEAKVLVISIARLKTQDNRFIQNFIDKVCGTMQEAASPGHHIAVQSGEEVFQAKAHHRASPAIFTAMKNSVHNKDSLARVNDKTIVVGTANYEDVTVFVSEYLSNIRRIVRAQVIRRIASIISVGLGLVIVLNFVLHKIIAIPLYAMVEVVRRFAAGQRSSRMPDSNTRELGVLTDEFNHMAEMIETAEKEHRQRLEKARTIQQNLLPDTSSLKNIKLACLFDPAAEVAGDYYDVITRNDHSILFCIADVIGHDVPAAMSAAMLKALLKEVAAQDYSLSKLIYRVHLAFSEVTLESDFATMLLAHWSPQNRRLCYVSAGHETAYLVRAKGRIEQLNPTGPILGFKDLSRWSQQDLAVEQGDRLILLTDGIIETFSPEGEVFGRKRVIEIIEKSRSEPIGVFSQRLIESVVAFRGSEIQFDDITMLAVEL